MAMAFTVVMLAAPFPDSLRTAESWVVTITMMLHRDLGVQMSGNRIIPDQFFRFGPFPGPGLPPRCDGDPAGDP